MNDTDDTHDTHDTDDMVGNDATEGLLSIGAFARRVGLAPSALRFYDDCAVLRPAHVDTATGYRYYAETQAPRAALLRRLREAELPLVDAAAVLDGPYEDAREVLRGHLGRTRESAAAARAALEEILRALPGGTRRAEVSVGGAELAGAVRQVGSAVAAGAAREEFPVLGRVLVEIDGEEIRLVATDRYRLAVRALRPLSITGEPCELLLDIDELTETAAWARRLPEVAVEVEGRQARVRGGGECRELAGSDEVFPAYRMVLDDLGAARHRVIADRGGLRRAVADRLDAGHRAITLTTTGDDLLISTEKPTEIPEEAEDAERPGATALRAIRTGPPLRIAFDPGVLLPALDASVGPDVLLEIASEARPVVVRSADQGSFTTLVMPVRNAAATS
ncbi:putative transcriptional regulator, MerR family protein [Streptomyces bingchenggensis BCW-1]|uniref:Putative transcriptional regulator, MerR family protein n=1 Tax=Streptomyces bingchenggensis (strain BCW-1) TaxID=749414 RepID=D7BTL6_STRBB|nr:MULTISPECIES: MerR family transcriptional regulator [Streptomyces]ADI07455.1 putative transcriptional regulator, MerR family protein [Streptomyces bingchenggensis BCW-1]